MPKHAKNKQSGGSRYQKHRQKCHETPFATADVANQLRNSVGIPAWQYGEANRIESVLRKQVDCEMDPRTAHIKERHVDLKETEVMERAMRKHDAAVRGQEKTKQNVERHGGKYEDRWTAFGSVSQFEDKQTMQDTLYETIQTHKLTMAGWYKNAKIGERFILKSDPMEKPIGHGYYIEGDKMAYREAHEATMLVERCDVFKDQSGIRLVTFYPDIQGDKAREVSADLTPLLQKTDYYKSLAASKKAAYEERAASTLKPDTRKVDDSFISYGNENELQAPQGPDY